MTSSLTSRLRTLPVPGGKTLGAVGYFFLLSVAVLGPLLGAGYLLTLDMVFAPGMDYIRFGLADKGPLYYGRLPVLVLLEAVTVIVPDWVVQQALLVGLLTCAGLAAFSVVRERSYVGALYAGTLYAINPFVAVRLLAGHWWFLYGYAFLPLAVCAFYRYLTESETDGALGRVLCWSTLVAVFDPHAVVLFGIAALAILSTTGIDTARRSGTRLLTFSGGFAGLNAYWLLPGVYALATQPTTMSTITAADLTVFTARGTVEGNVPLSIAVLHGFWRGGYQLAAAGIPRAVSLGVFAVVLYLAIHGAVRRETPARKSLVLTTVAGFLLGMGVSYQPTAPLFQALYDHVVLVRGMRDTQKFVALVALGYAVLGGYGVGYLEDVARPWIARTIPAPTARIVGTVLVLVVLVVPCLTATTMLGGFDGQIERTTYPDEWHAANEYLTQDTAEFRVLFLPWHQYMDFYWTDGIVANPAGFFFEKPVVRGRNLDIGTHETSATDPTHTRLRALLADQAITGPELASLGIKYVVLVEDVDYQRYGYLSDRAGLTVVYETDGIVVFENEAFDQSPPPASWPRTTPIVPRNAIGIGSLISAVCLLGAGPRWMRNRRGVRSG